MGAAMADLWYYTKNGTQQEPVTVSELKRLAAARVLRPTDLVWREGMAEWAEAATIRGLFSAAAAVPQTGTADADDREETEARPARRSRPTEEDDQTEDERPRRRRPVGGDEADDPDEAAPRRGRKPDDDDDDFVRPRRRRRRRTGMGTGAILGLIGGGIALVVVLIVVLIVALSGDSGTRSFSLAEGTKDVFHIRFQGGKKVELWVHSSGSSDVDLYVFDEAGRELRFDDGDSSDCYLWFLSPKTQTYRVEVRNMSRVDQRARNGHNSGTLKFQESDGQGLAPPPPQVHQGKIIPGGPRRRR